MRWAEQVFVRTQCARRAVVVVVYELGGSGENDGTGVDFCGIDQRLGLGLLPHVQAHRLLGSGDDARVVLGGVL